MPGTVFSGAVACLRKHINGHGKGSEKFIFIKLLGTLIGPEGVAEFERQVSRSCRFQTALANGLHQCEEDFHNFDLQARLNVRGKADRIRRVERRLEQLGHLLRGKPAKLS